MATEAKPRVCVISPGVAHAVPRTVAITPYVGEVHFIDMLGTADRRILERHGIYYYSMADPGDSVPPSVRLRRLMDRIGPDVICCHYGLGDHFFNAIAANRCPVAVIAMGTDVLHASGDTKLSALVGLLSRMALRRAGVISAKSRFLAAELARLGVRSPVDINYWGCDLRRFTPGARSAARARLGLPDRAKIVLSPRALKPLYNVHLIIEAFPAVLRRWPDAILVLLGSTEGPYADRVLEEVQRLEIGGHVRVIGEVGQDALPDYFRASDFVVSVASTEGFPNTVLEVMACAIPVVVGDIPQIRELLTDGVNARICPITVAGVEAAMGEILADPDSACRIAAAGRATATEAGDIDRNGARWARELRALAAAPAKQGFMSVAPYRLVLRFHQLARLFGYQ
jgi:glycosyltransferase involved in cell wall biosynthesis